MPENASLLQKENVNIRWIDDERTILLIDVLAPWTWDEAAEVIPFINKTIRENQKPTYSVTYFHPGAGILPRGIVPRLYVLMEDPPNEVLAFFTGRYHLLRLILSAVNKVYDIRGMMSKYRYCGSKEEALSIIDTHRRQQVK